MWLCFMWAQIVCLLTFFDMFLSDSSYKLVCILYALFKLKNPQNKYIIW